MQYFEKDLSGKKMLCRTENFLEYHEELNNLIQGKLNVAVADLLGEDSVMYKEKINFKLPGGKGFTAHQDAPAFTTFGQKYHITVMLGVDAAHPANGCLEVARGEHTKGLCEMNDDGTIAKAHEDRLKWEPVHSNSGDVLFFGSLLPHRSGPNNTNTPRRAFYLTYNPAKDGSRRFDYYADKRNNFPPDIERDPKKDYSKGAKQYNVGNPIHKENK
jgi:ectoine hydroxylase-related dioxygenase (phytanoyl-CoA dioxygenase family)